MATAALLAACGLADAVAAKPRLGLLTTLPIYWAEAAGVEEMLAGDAPPPWPRGVMEERFVPVPLDSLTGDAGLGSVDLLLLAQPRPLTAAENVALDNWVRSGGRVVLFADPMLTGHSRFHIGDRRRPQDVVLVSPILARWGLALEFVEDQPEGERTVAAFGRPVAVNLPGRLRREPGGAQPGDDCALIAEGLGARCTIGEGSVVVIADAALLEEPHDPDSLAGRQDALREVLALLQEG